jgi:glycosyltransferase involved in cell wall biosynthesis
MHRKWARWLIQAAPPPIKRWAGSHLPGMSRWLGNRAFDQIDRAALRRFARSHAQSQPLDRSLANGLAVVMPCYNHGRYLEATFASLFQQTHRPFQIICVDDCSGDDTSERLHAFAARLPAGIQLTLLRTPSNGGQAAAINFGIEQSGASLYVVLNDDDYLMHDALEAIWAIIGHRPEVALLGSTARCWRGDGCPPGDEAQKRIGTLQPTYTTIPLCETSPESVLRFTHPNDMNMTHSGMAFYRSAWQAAGGYYPDKNQRVVIFSDRDFQLRVAALFPTAISADIPFVYWREGSSVDSGVYT